MTTVSTMDRSKLMAYATKEIIDRNESIHFVFHDEDGDWHFMPNRIVSEGDASLVSIEQIIGIDSTIEDILSLPLAYMAERSEENEWIRKKVQ